MKPIFGKAPSVGARLLIIGLVSLGIILIDYNSNGLLGVRQFGTYVTGPFYWAARGPSNFLSGVQNYFRSREQLLAENEQLHSESRVLRAKVQKLVSLIAENVRLKELLSSSTVLEDSVLVAETVSVSPSPFYHNITIDKGEADGAYVGQAVIDAYGLLGQIVEVGAVSSRVILISDSRHSIPVQVNRNGVRAIAEGTGRIDTLLLPNVVETTDIKAGDLLVSSGLGQRFPVGYPVGVVESVESDPGQPFLRVVVRPSAKLNRGRYVLLVFAGAIAPQQK